MALSESDSARMERYRRLRTTAQHFTPKLYTLGGPGFDLRKAARKLNIPVDMGTLLFQASTDVEVLADFYLHEMRSGGKRIVDLAAEQGVATTDDERAILAAQRESRTSLFELVGVNPEASLLHFRDLLLPGAEALAVTDLNLSRSPIAPGDMLFMRIISLGNLQMSSGMFFGFRAVHRAHLLDAYAARMRTVEKREYSQRSYIFFYIKSREFGVDQRYADLPGETTSFPIEPS